MLFIILLVIGLGLLAWPGTARDISSGGTVFDYETGLNLTFAADGNQLAKYTDDDPTKDQIYSIPVKTQAEAIVIEQFGNENAQLSKAILDEHLEIKPRVNIPAGARILISPNRDIWFKPPTNNIVYAVPFELNKES